MDWFLASLRFWSLNAHFFQTLFLPHRGRWRVSYKAARAGNCPLISRGNCRWHRHDDVFGGRQLPLVIFQRRNHNLGFAGVGAMDGLALVAEGFLGEAFGVAARFWRVPPKRSGRSAA